MHALCMQRHWQLQPSQHVLLRATQEIPPISRDAPCCARLDSRTSESSCCNIISVYSTDVQISCVVQGALRACGYLDSRRRLQCQSWHLCWTALEPQNPKKLSNHINSCCHSLMLKSVRQPVQGFRQTLRNTRSLIYTGVEWTQHHCQTTWVISVEHNCRDKCHSAPVTSLISWRGSCVWLRISTQLGVFNWSVI